jgi:hypothetical protein
MNPLDELRKQIADGLRAEALKAKGQEVLEEIIRRHLIDFTSIADDILEEIRERVG